MRIALVTVLALGAAGALAQTASKPAEISSPAYDAALAQKLGADEYGMKGYVLVILKTGPKAAETPAADQQKLFTGHMTNIGRLANEGKLVVAGPMMKNEKHYEGIFIFNVKTVKEAEDLLVTDPAVAAGLLGFEAYGWYGTAAMQEIMGIHKRIAKKDH